MSDVGRVIVVFQAMLARVARSAARAGSSTLKFGVRVRAFASSEIVVLEICSARQGCAPSADDDLFGWQLLALIAFT